MDVIDDGWLRTRRLKDGSLEVWSKGWRLEIRALPVVPAVLAVAFLMASAPLLVRVIGTAVLMSVAFIAQRLTKVGVRFSDDGVTVVDIRETTHVTWDRFLGFVGQRGSDDGHCAIALSDGSSVRFSAVLNAGESDFYGTEEGLSMVDELNKYAERAQGKERSSSTPVPISVERIVLATAPRLLLDDAEAEMEEVEEFDEDAEYLAIEPAAYLPEDLAMEDPFVVDLPQERVDEVEPTLAVEPMFQGEPVLGGGPASEPEPPVYEPRPEPVHIPEPAIVVPEPAYVQSELVTSARSAPPVTPRELERLVTLPMPELTPQGDGTSPGARRLAAFLETQKAPEPLPAPVRRKLLAGLGRRKSGSR